MWAAEEPPQWAVKLASNCATKARRGGKSAYAGENAPEEKEGAATLEGKGTLDTAAGSPVSQIVRGMVLETVPGPSAHLLRQAQAKKNELRRNDEIERIKNRVIAQL